MRGSDSIWGIRCLAVAALVWTVDCGQDASRDPPGLSNLSNRSDAGHDGDAARTDGLGAGTGEPCQRDADCSAGQLCLLPAIGVGEGRYCAPPCTDGAGCDALSETSFNITVPDAITPQGGTPSATNFGRILARGTGCMPVAGHAGKFCQFACSPTQALGKDGHCYCLPGYALNAEKTECVFSPEKHQCSIFSLASAKQQKFLQSEYGIQVATPTCDACNSDLQFTDKLACHSSLFACEVNGKDLNGGCSEVLTQGAFESCLRQKTSFACSCDNSCADGCEANVGCIDRCCTCTQAPAAPRPTCNGKPYADATAGLRLKQQSLAVTLGATPPSTVFGGFHWQALPAQPAEVSIVVHFASSDEPLLEAFVHEGRLHVAVGDEHATIEAGVDYSFEVELSGPYRVRVFREGGAPLLDALWSAPDTLSGPQVLRALAEDRAAPEAELSVSPLRVRSAL